MPRIARSLLVSHLPSGAVLVAPLVRVCALGDSRTPNLEHGEPTPVLPLQILHIDTGGRRGLWRDGWQAPYPRLASGGAVVFANLEG